MKAATKQTLYTIAVYALLFVFMWIIDASGLVYSIQPASQLSGASAPFVEHKNTGLENQDADVSYVQSEQHLPIYPFGQVIKVVDGDTIKVATAVGTEQIIYTVRLIGINTPESVDPRRSVECFGKEAGAFTQEVLSHRIVELVTDDSQSRFDKYGRLLAYVYLPGDQETEKILFNELIIKEGYAFEYTYDRPYLFQKIFKQSEQDARGQQKGLWQEDVCQYVSVHK